MFLISQDSFLIRETTYGYYVEHNDDNLGSTVLNAEISTEEEEYVLFYLTMEDCMFQPRSTVKAIPLRGWADQPDHPHPIPNLP